MILFRRTLPTYAAAAFCAALLTARAGAQTPAATPAHPSGKEYVLKNISSFNAPPSDSRNPFWPIGWVPTAPVPVAAAAAPVIDVKAEQFTVTSISVDYPALAVINGQIRSVGERIAVPGNAQEFVSVKKISDGMVTLDYKGREIAVAPASAGLKKR